MSEDRVSVPPPSSLSPCPSCGKTVDTLRAGEVAILGGAFRYFCDRDCKAKYLDTLVAGARFHEEKTAEPPAVVLAVRGPAPTENVEIDNHTNDEVSDATRAGEEPGEAGEEPDEGETEPLPPVARSKGAPEASGEAANAEAAEPAEIARDADILDETDDADDAATEPLELPPAPPHREGLSAPSRISQVPPSAGAASARGGAGGAAAAASSATKSATKSASQLGPIRSAGIAFGLATAMAAAVVVAHPLALPLACASAAIAIACAFFPAARLPSARLPREWPIVVALAAALVAHARLSSGFPADAIGGMHAFSLDALTGLLAAALLAGEALFAGARSIAARTHGAISTALDVQARVVRGDAVETIAASRVKPGETVIVAEGETCGVDGAVGGGEARVIPWHGARSSEMQTKREGDVVVAGAIVTSGSMRVTTAWTGRDRAWIKLSTTGTSDAASVTEAPLTRLAAQIVELGPFAAAAILGTAAYLTHSGTAEVIGAAAAGGGVLACLAIVRAVAQVHCDGILAALSRGIVYKDTAAFDRAGRADVAVVCAQGTLLAGEPEVVQIEALSPHHDEKSLLALASGAETACPQALAFSLIHAAIDRGARPTDVRSATHVAGLGVSALAGDGERLLVGSRAFLLQEKVSVAKADARVSELETQGINVLLIALDSRLIGLVALQDGLRPGAREAVQRLGEVGLEPVLLSGDARQTCETVARELGVEHIRPEVLPADRGAEVRALGAGEGGHVVAVLGRAQRDDGALGAADVSVALASAGASPGEWTASLASEDVRDAALALALAKRVHERARLATLTGLITAGAGFLVLSFALAPLWIAPLTAFAGSFLAWRIVMAPSLAFDAAAQRAQNLVPGRATPSRPSVTPPPAPVSSAADPLEPNEPNVSAAALTSPPTTAAPGLTETAEANES